MKICQHNIFEKWPLEDKSVQVIITSPPFWSLRKYDIPNVIIGGNRDCEHEFKLEDKREWNPSATYKDTPELQKLKVSAGQDFCIYCQAWKGQHGLEPTFQLYIEHIHLWAKEAWRVLRDDGIFFLNLGDSYNSQPPGNKKKVLRWQHGHKEESGMFDAVRRPIDKSLPPKCKILIPHRVAIALIDGGWILRNDIIWYKPNAMPESVTDRFSKKFEYIFMFVKQQEYYFNLDNVRMPQKEISLERLKRGVSDKNKWIKGPNGQSPHGLSQPRPNIKKLTKHEIATQRRGSYQDPLHVKPYHPKGKNPGDLWEIPTQPSSFKHYAIWPEALVERMILCSTKPGDIILDPFVGSGTTVRVAERLNRIGVGFDLGYEDIQKERLKEIQKELSYEK